MQFESAAQRACYERIRPWVEQLFPTGMAADRSRPAFAISFGSAVVSVSVHAWVDDDSTICARAYVVTGAEVDQELCHYLLRENSRMRFGAFGLDADNDIFFEHSIVGSTCDPAELRASVVAVMVTADRYDDAIVSRWGGERALERAVGGGL